MSPKKSTPKSSTAPPSTTSKKAPAKPAAASKTTGAPKKPATTATSKPDQMPTDVLEFIQAIDDYKRAESRPFPSWSEILDIVKTLGYERADH